jgi:hypothetical protein
VALANQLQDDFSGGLYVGRKAPPTAVYDCVNGLINDEGLIFRRGGSEYKSNTAVDPVVNLADAYTAAGQRTIFTGGILHGSSWTLDTDDQTPVVISGPFEALTRGAAANGAVFFPFARPGYIWAYAGSRLGSSYSTGTMAVTNGSADVTGTGTAWLTHLDAGSLIAINGAGDRLYAVRSVGSDTSLTLTEPWAFTTGSGVTYQSADIFEIQPAPIVDYYQTGSSRTSGLFITSVGAQPRLVVATKQRVFMSNRGTPTVFDATDYLELPSDVEITGADALGGTAVIFTTRGVWGLSNLDFDAVDAVGNVQWQQQQLNKDLILWGDAGVAAWAGRFVVPAVDDVWLFSLDGPPEIISGSRFPGDGGIRTLYRGYVSSGFQPGIASVYRGHYLLPIVDPDDDYAVQDVLVCRLDRGFTWTRWAGHAAGIAYAQRVGASSRTPKLLGASGSRVTDLTGCFDPTDSNTTDADGTAPDFELVTRDMPTGANQPGFAAKVRARYELDSDTATIAVAFSSDQDDGVFTDLTERGEQDGGSGWAASDGSKYQWAIVGKRRERIRFRFRLTGASSRFVLRSIELLTRPSGKQ